MPTYSFKNTDTDEIFDLTLKMAEREQYLADNPHIKQTFTSSAKIVDPYVTGHTKTSDGFNDLLKNMKRHHRGSTIQVR